MRIRQSKNIGTNTDTDTEKPYNLKNQNKLTATHQLPHWTKGLNRRDFIKSSLAISLLATITACKPSLTDNLALQSTKLKPNIATVRIETNTFSDDQQLSLDAIFMRLFPDDGNGPSANDLNVTTYLEWAMTDENNIADGDPDFIMKGIGWLNQLSQDNLGKKFRDASAKQQDELITQTIKSDVGKNWVAILLYYVVEALTLDPFYGGNTNQIGWKWLEYQGGFPHPVQGKTYRDFS
jgi:gluconate 2-dehydrogenase gamma chain